MALLAGIVFGAAVGSAQWLVLRREVHWAGWWIVISTLAWAAGLGLLPGFLMSGVMVGAMTGLALDLLLRYPCTPPAPDQEEQQPHSYFPVRLNGYAQQEHHILKQMREDNECRRFSTYSIDVIHRFMIDVFSRLGTPPDEARICADVLIASDLRGIESHGVGRLKYYYDRIQAGVQFTKTEIEIVKETETTAVVDGHHGMGHVIAYRAMRMAMDKARQYGLGAVAVRNGTHFGIAGYYPLMAAEEGMMGLTVTNARPAIAPTFGTEPMLGTNPIAFAAPSDMDFPFCFDGATSITQRGKIEVAARAEKPVPEGWVIDAEGQPLTDPEQILEDLGKAARRPAAAGRRGRAAGRLQGLRPGDDGRDPVGLAVRWGCS